MNGERHDAKEIDKRNFLKYVGVGLAAGLGVLVGPTLAKAQTSGVEKRIFERDSVLRTEKRLHARWVHGTSVEAEYPENLMPNGVQRKGWGTVFVGKGGSTNWFHISIPTPVLIDNRKPELSKVFVFYKTASARINTIHIYDGPKKIKEFDNLSLYGDHYGHADGMNTWVINPSLPMSFGLGISVGVRFSVCFDQPCPPLELLFTTAGAEFSEDIPIIHK